MNKRYHIIYLVECLITGEVYVGKHSTNKLNDGYMGSGGKITRLKKKLGILNFKKHIIQQDSDEKSIFLLEEEIISITKETYGTKCLNVAKGGNIGNGMCGLIATTKGYKWMYKNDDVKFVEPTNIQTYLELGYEFGYPISKNRTFDHNYHKNMSKIKKLQNTGILNWNYGKTGELSGSYGHKWIHNDSYQLRVKPEDLPKFLEQGYVMGKFKKGHPLYKPTGGDKRDDIKRITGYKYINNGFNTIVVKPEDLSKYLKRGYVKGKLKQ